MAKFKVTFKNASDDLIEADDYSQVTEDWIEFYRTDGDDVIKVARIAAGTIFRIDRVEN